eukprot:1189261-Rhodomonas_salina.4
MHLISQCRATNLASHVAWSGTVRFEPAQTPHTHRPESHSALRSHSPVQYESPPVQISAPLHPASTTVPKYQYSKRHARTALGYTGLPCFVLQLAYASTGHHDCIQQHTLYPYQMLRIGAYATSVPDIALHS